MEMGATVAFQEDSSWQNEAEHQQRLRNQAGHGVEIEIRKTRQEEKKHFINNMMKCLLEMC